MSPQSNLPAKLSRPLLSGVLERERLFQTLDTLSGRPVTWISAPGGSGKSTLAASYLDARALPCIWYKCDDGDADPATFFYYLGIAANEAAPRFRKPLPLLTAEYLAGIPTFTRKYFETLYGRLISGEAKDDGGLSFVVILDNYQDVPADAPFHDIIATALSLIPSRIRVMVLSRTPPPPFLARQIINNNVGLVTFDDMRFTIDESRRLMSLQSDVASGSIESIHKRALGWVAGIILLLERNAAGLGMKHGLTNAGAEQMFDYFAAEVFERLGGEMRDFLLMTAMLPTMSVEDAVDISGVGRAGQILATLHHHHLFTEMLASATEQYQYHPLFRDFLLMRARRDFSPEQVRSLQDKAAAILERSNHPECAARLYCESSNIEGLVRLVLKNGHNLMGQGRNRVLAEWIAAIPAQRGASDPWILYWNGISSFPADLERSRSYLAKAQAAFADQEDVNGCYLAWAGIVDSHAYGYAWAPLDECLADFDELHRRFPSIPTTDAALTVSSRMLLAHTLRRTDAPEQVEEWLLRVKGLLRQKPSLDIQIEATFCMSVFYLWRGEYEKNCLLLARAASEIRNSQPSPFGVIRIKLMSGIHKWISADYADARKLLDEGLTIARESGVRLYDSLLWSFKSAAELASGNLEQGATYLQEQLNSLAGQKSALNLYFYHLNSAWLELLCGRLYPAIEHMEIVHSKAEIMGTPYYRALYLIGKAQIIFLQGNEDEALNLLQSANHIAINIKSGVMEWYSLLMTAWILLQQGKREQGLLPLGQAMALARRYGYVHLEFFQPSAMSLLCATALEHGIEPEYACHLVRRIGLKPPGEGNGKQGGTGLHEWPYSIKIYTFGRFEIVRHGETLTFAGKEQKKPLEMLKVLITYGGREVARERFTDILWPDADGDQALKSFETTLSRLRKLLGNDEFIICRSRHLTLNPTHCWVDSFALETILETAKTAPPDQLEQLCARSLGLYKGTFLSSEGSTAWVLYRRELQMNRMLKLVTAVGRDLEATGAWDNAAEYFLAGLTIDQLAEECYRRLMSCYYQLGNNAAVAKTYQRCRSLLNAELGIEPSTETTAIFEAIAS